MANSTPVVLILGSGSRVGYHVGRAFAAKGYKVAHTSRSVKGKENIKDEIHISGNLSNPESVPEIFSKVKSSLGIPSVVIYNASAGTLNDPKDPLSLPYADLKDGLNVTTLSAFVAAQQAVLGFNELPDSASKTFIYTGNALNDMILAPMMIGGVGKSATAHIIESAAAAYQDRAFKFYYGDERKADGSPAYSIDGEAHGKLYVQLAENKSQQPWQQTFINDVGYKNFSAGYSI